MSDLMRTEREMCPEVEKWLRRQGYRVVNEAPFPWGICDLVGFRFEERKGWRIPQLVSVVAVELKIDRIGDVLSQAKSHRPRMTASYVAMPSWRVDQMRVGTLERFKEWGIGLLSVGVDTKIVTSAVHILDRDLEWLKKRMWRRQKREDSYEDGQEPKARSKRTDLH